VLTLLYLKKNNYLTIRQKQHFIERQYSVYAAIQRHSKRCANFERHFWKTPWQLKG